MARPEPNRNCEPGARRLERGAGAGSRRFRFSYRATIAAGPCARLWFPSPLPDEHQAVLDCTFDLPTATRVQLSTRDGNGMLFVELAARENEVTNSLSFEIERRRRFAPTPVRAPYPDPLEELGFGRYLAGNARVPVDGHFGEQARALIASDALPLEKTRAVFDHILQTYSYDSSGCTPEKGDSLGNLEVACDLKLGTCTELHGLLIAYLRALGVPARFAFGFNVRKPLMGSVMASF